MVELNCVEKGEGPVVELMGAMASNFVRRTMRSLNKNTIWEIEQVVLSVY